MSIRYKIGDPVIYRENSSFAEPFDFNEEPLYIIFDYVENEHISPYRKKFLLKQGYIYIISNIKEDCGSGYLGFIFYAKEDQLKLYDKSDKDVLSFYKDARNELEEELLIRNKWYVVAPLTGDKQATNIGTIHYSKTGYHIVPFLQDENKKG